MSNRAIYVYLKAKPGKEAEVENFLISALPLVEEEPETRTWYALKMSSDSFAIFDTFESEAGMNAHLNGKVAEALMAKAPELFENEIKIDQVSVIASK